MNGWERMIAEQREEIERLRGELAGYERRLRECHASIAAMRRNRWDEQDDRRNSQGQDV